MFRVVGSACFTGFSPPPQAATPETAEVGRIDLGDWAGGEALFVPKHADGEGEEDDGFLVSFVSPTDSGNSGTWFDAAEYVALSTES